MPGLNKIAFLLAVILLLALGRPSNAYAGSVFDSYDNQLLDGHKIINVVDDFLVFWKQAEGQTLRRQRKLWRRMVESKHQDYFDRAVFRNAGPEEREAMLDQFLIRVPWHVEQIAEFNLTAKASVIEGLENFKFRFNEYQQKTDIYIGLGLFMFDGSIRPVENEIGIPDTLCLGVESLASYSPEELRIVIAHELFHLYHFGFLFEDPSSVEFSEAHMPLMIEGLAVAATEAIYPYRPASLYLHFSDEELAFQEEELVFNCQRFLDLMGNNAPSEQYEQWFTSASNEDLPARGGYLLGYEVSKRVLAGFSLEQVVRMTPAQLREHAEEQLTAMISDQVLLVVPFD
ncbi:MAG TPA: DUF2268 domain-containing putative Zn-dependent protease [Blastocatellia bacterium]|jgi:hypothetical protein|nr:DUF2268 domain-containing putative Zn-dependent protease [Blastocatellia bacterium]